MFPHDIEYSTRKFCYKSCTKALKNYNLYHAIAAHNFDGFSKTLLWS